MAGNHDKGRKKRKRNLSPVSRRAFIGRAAKVSAAVGAVASAPWVLQACDSGYSESEYCNIAYCNDCGRNYTADPPTCYCDYSDYSEEC